LGVLAPVHVHGAHCEGKNDQPFAVSAEGRAQRFLDMTKSVEPEARAAVGPSAGPFASAWALGRAAVFASSVGAVRWVNDRVGTPDSRQKRIELLADLVRRSKQVYGNLKRRVSPRARRALRNRATQIAVLERHWEDASAPREQAQIGNSSNAFDHVSPAEQPHTAERRARPLKVALFIHGFLVGKGGAEKVAAQLANVLAESGMAVDIICRRPFSPPPVYDLDERVRLQILTNIKDASVATLKGERYDLLVGFGMRGSYERIPQIADILDVPFIIQECNNPDFITQLLSASELCRDWIDARWLRQGILAHAAGVRLTVPNYAESLAGDIKPFTYAFYNAFTLPRQNATPAGRAERKKFICVGALKNEIKNGMVAVDAFCRFSRYDSDASLFLYGDNHYKSAVARLCEAYANAMVIDCGFVNEMSEIYSDAYAMIIPSYTEGLPSVVVEAFSYGVPCIGFSDCDGVRHLIQHEQTGLLVDREVPDGLADALRKIADPNFRQVLSDNARRFADNNLSFAQWRANWLQMINNAVNRRNNEARPQFPAAYDPAHPRSQHWRDLLKTFMP
jgi:glycosyltransferase involved in cell wall biosynthesis